MNLSPLEAMQRATRLAELSPSPDANPRVGCVLTSREGELLAEGYHRGAGTKHAEADALATAARDGVDVTGASAYVTLEPCAHQGRTPSCAKALIAAGVGRVVYAQADPNGAASGGAELLERAGVRADFADDFAQMVAHLNPDWTFSVTHKRPRVTWKYAATMDGFSAAVDGTSQWITGPAARADVHRLRAEHGAILVGTGTALADNPRLTVRGADGSNAPRQPLRVVAGRRPVPRDFHLHDDAAPTLFVTQRDPHSILRRIHERGVHSVWLEGGPTLAAAFLRAGLVDDVVAYLAPTFLGSGRAAAAQFDAETLSDAKKFTLLDATLVRSESQTDVRVRLTRTSPERD